MLGKLNRSHNTYAYNTATYHIGNAYNHTKNLLHNVDSGIRTAKTVYSVLAPYIEQYGGSHINKHAVKAIGHYEDIRHKVMEGHDKASNEIHDIKNTLSKHNILKIIL